MIQFNIRAKNNSKLLIHFIGIGGVGMLGLAEILVRSGVSVQGSDLQNVDKSSILHDLGCKLFIGHDSSNVDKADIVVISSIITSDNIEYQQARKLGIPIYSRGKLLSDILSCSTGVAVLGTHGKTTVSSCIGYTLTEMEADPTVIVGGIVHNFNGKSRVGKSNIMVAEIDESDGSFLYTKPDIAVITNIDHDHLDYYGSFEKLKESFITYISNMPFYSTVVICIDDKGIQDIYKSLNISNIITYGFSQDADYQILNYSVGSDGAQFDIKHKHTNTIYPNIKSKLFGKYNMQNILASYIVCKLLEPNIEHSKLQGIIPMYLGVKRRFNNIGTINGATIIDDYAHHPTEIQCSLSAAYDITKNNVIAVVQPHRASRLHVLFENFINALYKCQKVIILPTYTMKNEVEKVTGEDLVKAINDKGGNAHYVSSNSDLTELLLQSVEKGDIALFMGAGDITNIAYSIAQEHND